MNAHGWPVPYGPMGATVRSLRMLLPSGDVVDCSRIENSNLFKLAMGGYGLIGVIIDLVVDMAPNFRFRRPMTLWRPRIFLRLSKPPSTILRSQWPTDA